jgi:hypothetical protein
MFVYGLRCARKDLAFIPEHAVEDVVYLADHDLLIFPDLTHASSLKSHGPTITDTFRWFAQRLISDTNSVWETEWIEHPFLTENGAEVVRALRTTPTWYYVPADGLPTTEV